MKLLIGGHPLIFRSSVLNLPIIERGAVPRGGIGPCRDQGLLHLYGCVVDQWEPPWRWVQIEFYDEDRKNCKNVYVWKYYGDKASFYILKGARTRVQEDLSSRKAPVTPPCKFLCFISAAYYCAQFTLCRTMTLFFIEILWLHERIESTKADIDYNAFLMDMVCSLFLSKKKKSHYDEPCR